MEQNLIYRAIENLYTSSGVIGEVQQTESTDRAADGYDGVLRLMHTSHAVEIPFIVKGELGSNQVKRLKSVKSKALIVFEKASDVVKEQLRKCNISYLETSGNAFLSLDTFFLFIDTLKGSKRAESKGGKAFSKTGLKIIYALLSNGHATKASYRNIADIAGASIDSVGRVLRELISDNYLVRAGNSEYNIINRQRLLNDWATMFNKTLRPKLKARVFDFVDGNTELRSLLNQNTGGLISGELAAEAMENHLISRKANVYVEGSFVDFALKNNLQPNKNGRITLIEKFWNTSDNYFEVMVGLASPILVYADLLDDPSPRNIEAAQHILNRTFHESV